MFWAGKRRGGGEDFRGFEPWGGRIPWWKTIPQKVLSFLFSKNSSTKNYLKKGLVPFLSITCHSSVLFWFAPFSFHFYQVCQHLGRDHHGFGSIHLWILLLDRQEDNISISNGSNGSIVHPGEGEGLAEVKPASLFCFFFATFPLME